MATLGTPALRGGNGQSESSATLDITLSAAFDTETLMHIDNVQVSTGAEA